MIMTQLDRLRHLKEDVLRIAGRHNAGKIYIFGSCARGEETPESDVDFVADFKAHSTLFNVVGLELDLSDLLGCSVDVVTLDRLEKEDEFSRTVRKEMLELSAV